MSGSEFGERIHNFFGQEGLSQDQNQSHVVDGTWSSISNGLGGNQRQMDPSLIANLKSYSTQQSGDPERDQSSNSHYGLNLTQQPIRPEHSRSLLQEHQNPTNGYNFLGVDSESSGDKLSVRGFTPDIHKSSMRFEMGESPVNYDFFGGQQQSNSQLPGVLQPFPRQQMTFNDMQLLKQQVMAKQMHEYQREQQLQKQQLETRQLNYLNSDAVNGSRSSDNQSHPLINRLPLQKASNNCWQPDLINGNTNWMHQGSSSGFMITPEHGHANLLAQQFEPSLYGMPLGGANAPKNSLSSVQMNRFASQHGSANKNSSLANQPTSFMNQGDVQDSDILPRSPYQDKVLFSQTPVPCSKNRLNSESFQQDDSRKRNNSLQEKCGQMEGSCPPEKSYMKVPENITSFQKSTALDPTEENILFGSDDNLWEAFGNSTDMSLTGNLMSSNSDLFDACPSLQSGSWSALMQSAVAETSSDDAVVHQWGSKQQSVWGNNNTAPHVSSSNTPRDRVHSDSTQSDVQHVHNRGNKVSDNGLLEKPVARSQMAGNIFQSLGSGIDRQNTSFSIRKNEGIEDRLGMWKAASNPNLADPKEQNSPFTQDLQMQRARDCFGDAGVGDVSNVSRDVQGNIQEQLDNNSVEKATHQLKSRDGSQILESYASENGGSNEMVKALNVSTVPGGKETQSGHVGVRPSIPRKFQYHPMGNIDVTDEPGRENFSHFGRSKTLGQPAMDIRLNKGHVSQNELNCTNSAFKSIGSEKSPGPSASPDNQVKSALSRFELLHKVDQWQEHSLETNVSRIPEATTSAEYVGQFQHHQSSASQGFSLQLAPPSQLAPSPDNVQFWNQPSKPQPDILRPRQFSSNNVEGSFSRQDKTNQLSSQNVGDVSLSGRNMVNTLELQGQDMGAKQTSDAASMFSKMVQSNHQTFGHHLPSNNFPKDNLRHNEHMDGSGESDAPMMTVKRVEDSGVHLQKVASRGEQQSHSRSDGLLRDGLNQKDSGSMLHFGQAVAQSFSSKNHLASAGADHQQISPQMAPSWYKQYGTFKNGLVNDTGRFTPLKIEEKSSNVGSSADGSHYYVQSPKQFNMQQKSGSAPRAETPSTESLRYGATDKVMKVDKPKKRKTATSGLLSWNKEVMHGSEKLKTLSEAEVDWARATNRFAEKVEFGNLLEDGSPLRSKRRLIYTTQLVQQLFRPPPTRVASLLASTNHEFVAYIAARAALGDACSSTCSDRSDHFLPPTNSNPLSERTKTEKISGQYISKATEDFINRTLKLETNFAGLEKEATIADLRVEFEDLEKFAVINRFARFHPSSSSSIDRTVSPVRLNSQRYVTIAPMPRNIPDRVQCLSL